MPKQKKVKTYIHLTQEKEEAMMEWLENDVLNNEKLEH